MKNRIVWVEENNKFQAIRIFRSEKLARAAKVHISLMVYAVAVFHIRRLIWLRSNGYCEVCAVPVTESSGHMHEKLHRGQGGEISLENSVFICSKCHQLAHKDRNPRWREKSLD